MEVLIATAIGTLTATGIYLTLRRQTFPVVLGLSLLSYAVNIFIFAAFAGTYTKKQCEKKK